MAWESEVFYFHGGVLFYSHLFLQFISVSFHLHRLIGSLLFISGIFIFISIFISILILISFLSNLTPLRKRVNGVLIRNGGQKRERGDDIKGGALLSEK